MLKFKKENGESIYIDRLNIVSIETEGDYLVLHLKEPQHEIMYLPKNYDNLKQIEPKPYMPTHWMFY